METKKSTKANLEKTKTMGVLMGIVVALSVLFAGFEWGSNMKFESAFHGGDWGESIIDVIPPTPPPLPPAAPEKIKAPDILTVVDDDTPETGEVPPSEGNEPVYIPPTLPSGVEDVEQPDEDIFFTVEKMPAFPGGNGALLKFIAQSIKYPAVAIENGYSGMVVCSFVIDKDGSITDVEILRKSIDASLDAEAVRVIKSMPKWSPGMQRDKAVRVRYTIPVKFKLQ